MNLKFFSGWRAAAGGVKTEELRVHPGTFGTKMHFCNHLSQNLLFLAPRSCLIGAFGGGAKIVVDMTVLPKKYYKRIKPLKHEKMSQ